MRLEIQAGLAKMPNVKSMGDVMDILRIAKDGDEARTLKAAYMARIKADRPNADALDIANSNIGYFTGYENRNEARRLLALYDCLHPIFGRSHVDGTLTPEAAFEMGKKMGEAAKNAEAKPLPSQAKAE